MEYKPKPFPKVSKGMKSGESKRQAEKKKTADKAKLHAETRQKDIKAKEKLHAEMIQSNKIMMDQSEINANKMIEVLSGVKLGISEIKLDVPELLEGNKIASSLTENSQKIESILSDIVNNIDKIKLEIPESQDIKPYVKSLTDAIKTSMSVLKSSISELNQSVAEIRLEQQPQPVEWDFEVSAHKLGEKYTVKATAYYGEE